MKRAFSQTILLAMPVTIEANSAAEANGELDDTIAMICACHEGMRHERSIEFVEDHETIDPELTI